MRKVLYALPVLLFGIGVLMVGLTVARLVIVGLAWLTFFIEYRYGREGREGELVAIGIATSLALLPVSQAISQVLAVFTLLLVLGGNYIKELCISQ